MFNRKNLLNLDLYIAAVALLILIVVTFGGVIMRYIVSRPIIWSEEVQLWCFLWLVFMGGSAAFRYGSHVAVEMIYDRMPKALQARVKIFNYVVTMLILGNLAYLGCDMLGLMVKIGKSTSILHVPFWFINLVVPLCCVLMMVSCTLATFFMPEDPQKSADTSGSGADHGASPAAGEV